MTDAARDYLTTSINPDKIGQYQQEAPELIREVEERIGSTLSQLGYL